VLNDPQIGQAIGVSSEPDPPEPPDLRDVFTSWLPSTGSDGAVETLECLPGLARANEVWEHDLAGFDPSDCEDDERGLFYVHSCSSLDGLDADESPWQGPETPGLDPQARFR
jgi:hypothetical protein